MERKGSVDPNFSPRYFKGHEVKSMVLSMHSTLRAKEVSSSLMTERLLKEYTNLSKEDLDILYEYLASRGYLVITRGSNDASLELMKWKVPRGIFNFAKFQDPKFIPNLCPYDPVPKDKVYELVQKAQVAVESKDRTHHLKTYKHCFVGPDAIGWMMSNYSLPTKDNSVVWGQQLQEDGYLDHVSSEYWFADKSSLFFSWNITVPVPRVLGQPNKDKPLSTPRNTDEAPKGRTEKNRLESTKIYKKGFVVQEYSEGEILISNLFEKHGKTQLCGARGGLKGYAIFFPYLYILYPPNTMRIYNFDTKAFTSFEVDNFKPGAFVMADGRFVCYSGTSMYCCSAPSLEDKTSLFRCSMEANLPEFEASLSKLRWPYVLLACKTSCKLYNLQSGTCLFSHKTKADIISTHLDLEGFTIFHSDKFLAFSPEIGSDKTISSDEGDTLNRSRSLSNVGASSGDDASERTFVPIPRKTLDRKGSSRTKRRMRQNSLPEGEDSDVGSASPSLVGTPDSPNDPNAGRLAYRQPSREVSRSPSASRSMSPARFSVKMDSIDPESSDSTSIQNEKTPIYVSGIKTSHEIRFGDPDNEENITYNEKTVKTGTFSKLVEKLTAATAEIDIDDFLLTYRAYSTPNDLLVALLLRYNSVGAEEKVVRLRVINVLRAWLEKYRYDFEKEPETKTHLCNFLDETIAGSPNAAALLSVKNKLLSLPPESTEQTTKTSFAPPISFPPPLPGGDPGILQFPSIEIARQLTIIEWEIWSKIKPWELIGLAWTKSKKNELAPNVVAMTEHFNKISNWVATQVITMDNPKTRVRVVKKMIQICQCLRTLGNYNGVLMFYSGLQRGPVTRMRATMKAALSDSKSMNDWNELEEVCNREKNYANLRKAIQNSAPPIIPYPGMYLSDILFTDEGNKDKINGLINYYKCQLIAEYIKRIKQYQLTGYDLTPHPPLQAMIHAVTSLDENTLYSISNHLEPREGKEPGDRPPELDTYRTDKRDVFLKSVPVKSVSQSALLRRKDSIVSASSVNSECDTESESDVQIRTSKSSRVLMKKPATSSDNLSAPSPRPNRSLTVYRATSFGFTTGNFVGMVGTQPVYPQNILVHGGPAAPSGSSGSGKVGLRRSTSLLMRKSKSEDITEEEKTDFSVVITAYLGELSTYHTKSGKKIWSACQDVPSSPVMCMSSLGKFIAIAYQDKKIVIWKMNEDTSLTSVLTIDTNFVVNHLYTEAMVLYAASTLDPEKEGSVSVSFLVLNLSNLNESK